MNELVTHHSPLTTPLRLGVNIDHVATIRNARGGVHPDPVLAALLAMEAGADGITAHLREDRRHIRDVDMLRLKAEVGLPLNFEMAATDEMLEIALRILPNAACIVPEKRQEVTTEGGLDVVGNMSRLKEMSAALREKNIRVSLFIDADNTQLDAAKQVGADIVELHTGTYCEVTDPSAIQLELQKIQQAAAYGVSLGLEIHAGHGLRFDNVAAIAAIPQIVELNIGHFLIGEAVFSGLGAAIAQMRAQMDAGRNTNLRLAQAL